MKKLNNQNKFLTGFTLIEILVVVSIIGFITTIVLVSLNSARAKAKETAGIQQLKQVKNAINMFFSDNGYYPEGNINDLESILAGINPDNKVYIPEITDNSQLMYFGINCD
jgi:prepilin-type N-terminal cleavage/methylation domain-containing protein